MDLRLKGRGGGIFIIFIIYRYHFQPFCCVFYIHIFMGFYYYLPLSPSVVKSLWWYIYNTEIFWSHKVEQANNK